MISDSRETARRGLAQRFFAWMHSQGEAGEYDEVIAPYKRRLFADLSGTVLEIGAGTGENFPFYPSGIHWIGVEPNFFMQENLLKRAKEYQIDGDLKTGVAEKLPTADASIDAVVGTTVMCSVTDQAVALGEILRVLRPGGHYLFIEHVAAANHSRLWWTQKLIKPAWKLAADGCNVDRATGETIREAGFSQVEIEEFRAPLSIASPHIAGVAVK
jgi:ubiquinone/menaquinone biosynthesis C-methylase UbiE